MPRCSAFALAAAATVHLLAGTAAAQAASRPDLATVVPVLETDAAHAGADVQVALQVVLAPGVHVNSNQPRDPSLIPLAITVNAPPNVSVVGIAFPKPSDLRQRGEDVLLSVFEHTFNIGVRLRLGADVAETPLLVSARLRYQACDEVRCYVPATVTTQWAIPVVPPSTPLHTIHPDAVRSLVFENAFPPWMPRSPGT
jgi:DsbC/DsbD-like thiol-disulfide interchange protein